MKNIYTMIISILLISSNVNSQPATGQFYIQYTDRGITSNIFFSVPNDYDSTISYPFIMAWHGAGDTGNNMLGAVNAWLASRIGAILVCPDANSINGQDASFLSNLINAAYSQTRLFYNIDTTKMIIMGFSWGGSIAYQIGLLNPHLFTGIIGLSPAIASFSQAMWDNIQKIPMATILGTADFNYTSVTSLMNQIPGKGGNLLFLVKPGVQHTDNVYFNSQEIKDDFKSCYDFVTGDSININDIVNPNNDIVSIFPNPVSDKLNIKTMPDHNGIIEISISNISGIVVYDYFGQEYSADTGINVDLSKFSSGFYYCRIRTGNIITYKKIIKVD